MSKDIFKEYLENGNTENRQIALTASSYKNYSQKHNKQTLSINDTNERLATYGDALLRHALCQILFEEKVSNITQEKEKYEKDEVLVKVVAKEYGLLNCIRFDKDDNKIPQDYNYKRKDKEKVKDKDKDKNKGNDSPHKYIATAVEALLAAIYLDNNKDFKLVVDVVSGWKKLIDNNAK